MAEYIERETLVERLTRNLNACNPGTFSEMCYQDAINTVTAFPAADVAPVRHGRWLGWGKSGTPTYENYGTCSVCGEDAEIYTKHRNYCPNCDARMDGGDE